MNFDRSGHALATGVQFDLAIGITDEFTLGAIHGNNYSSVSQTNLNSH